MKNTNILYGVIGLLAGIIIVGGVCIMKSHRGYDMDGMKGMKHSMSMKHSMDSMNMELSGKTGDEFDQAFLREMIIHHEGALTMAEAVLKTSKKPELIKLANDIISAQQKEITIMKGWQDSWYK